MAAKSGINALAAPRAACAGAYNRSTKARPGSPPPLAFRRPSEPLAAYYPNTFNLAHTMSNRDQYRALKKAVRSTLGSSASSRRQMQQLPQIAIPPSPQESECSTLADSPPPYSAEDVVYTNQAALLSSDNCAWARDQVSQSHSSEPTPEETAVMLDSDDMAWNLPQGKKRMPLRILHALAGQ